MGPSPSQDEDDGIYARAQIEGSPSTKWTKEQKNEQKALKKEVNNQIKKTSTKGVRNVFKKFFKQKWRL